MCLNFVTKIKTTQQVITRSKLTIETLEKGVNMFEVNKTSECHHRSRSSVSFVDFKKSYWVTSDFIKTSKNAY